MLVEFAETEAKIKACYQVMEHLRPHIKEEEFVARIRRQEKLGYRLAYLEVSSRVIAVAGFRFGENLAWGRFLYVDDLVTLADFRSQGFGAHLLSWLRDLAVREGCAQLHLDSGTQRKDAHRFYEREGLTVTGLHFVVDTRPADSGVEIKPRS